MKKVILTIFSLSILSCTDKTQNDEIIKLKAQNDSLLKITNSLTNKFVFDQARVKIIDSKDNTFKIGSEYSGTFAVIAFNKSDDVLFSTKLMEGSFDLKDPEKLKHDFDGYAFKTRLNSKSNDLHFKVNINSKVGRNLDGITISDKKLAN